MRSALVLLLLVLFFVIIVGLIFVLGLALLLVFGLLWAALIFALAVVLVLHNEHSFYMIWNYILIIPRNAPFYAWRSLNCHKR